MTVEVPKREVVVPEGVRRATGLHVTLDDDFVEGWREAVRVHPPTEGSVEVAVRHGGETLEMTFDEFLRKLGFEVKGG